MKRTITVLLSILLLGATLLTSSCGDRKIYSVKEIVKVDTDYRSKVLSESVMEIPELSGYNVERSNKELVVFSKELDGGLYSYKVLSLGLKRVVRTLEETSSRYDIQLVGDTSAFFVKKTVYNLSLGSFSGLAEVVREEYHLYDVTEALIAISLKETYPYLFADLLVFDSCAYSFDDRGALVPSFRVPEYVGLEECTHWNDEYFYTVTDRTVTVYDRSMNSLFYWEAPSYAADTSIFVMNDSNLLVQYDHRLNDDAEEYDFLSADVNGVERKHDLVTLILSVEEKKVRSVDVEYRIADMVSYREAKQIDRYGELQPFENMALIYPIMGGKIDTSEYSADLVLMNNTGEKETSLLFVSMQTPSVPKVVGDGVYSVSLMTGETALIDEAGNIRHRLSGEYRFVDGNMVGTRGIYRLSDMTALLDFSQSGATVTAVIDNTVFITEPNDNGYTVYTLRGTVKEALYSYSEGGNNPTVLRILEEGRCYEIYSRESGEYKYYNSEGRLMFTDSIPMDDDFTVTDHGILAEVTNGLISRYYILTDATVEG